MRASPQPCSENSMIYSNMQLLKSAVKTPDLINDKFEIEVISVLPVKTLQIYDSIPDSRI